MKPLSFLKIALLIFPLLLTSCAAKKTLVNVEKPVKIENIEQQKVLQKVSDNAMYSKFITSKVKFQIEVGSQNMTLTGNLKMKRDDVIRLQLMMFGFVEAGRLEFTKDYVLIVDRINKQYIKATYDQLDFLRNSGLNFYSLQALFWNELFEPGQTKVTDEMLKDFATAIDGGNTIITLSRDKMNYKWLADNNSGQLNMANILYKDKLHGQTQLNWDYREFKSVENKTFPTDMKIDFTTANKEVKINLILNNVGHDSEWEPRTTVSSKYTEVTVNDILRRFMAL
ncbi:DUF4292 domain-containing protein [Xylanibacter oryzae]|uniref:DUF4292 domain-containing protein n=1 Tax=Xylanibacter oryzae TaxID=185293 RepID=UPI0004AFFAA5|nr:DUF4292 domain-containing protein [Xylanibacter oryzae]